MKTQKDLERAWFKIELNSLYKTPPTLFTPMMLYDKNKAQQITKESKEYLMLMLKIVDEYLINNKN